MKQMAYELDVINVLKQMRNQRIMFRPNQELEKELEFHKDATIDVDSDGLQQDVKLWHQNTYQPPTVIIGGEFQPVQSENNDDQPQTVKHTKHRRERSRSFDDLDKILAANDNLPEDKALEAVDKPASE